MPLYERRKNGKPVERVRAVARGFEDTRLGLLAADRKGADGWHLVDETQAAKPTEGADSKG